MKKLTVLILGLCILTPYAFAQKVTKLSREQLEAQNAKLQEQLEEQKSEYEDKIKISGQELFEISLVVDSLDKVIQGKDFDIEKLQTAFEKSQQEVQKLTKEKEQKAKAEREKQEKAKADAEQARRLELRREYGIEFPIKDPETEKVMIKYARSMRNCYKDENVYSIYKFNKLHSNDKSFKLIYATWNYGSGHYRFTFNYIANGKIQSEYHDIDFGFVE